MSKFVPAEPIPPCEFLKDELNARGWTQADLAAILGITHRQVANIVSGKSGITPETAHSLGQAFGQEPETWMNLQVSYELALAAKSDRDVAKRAAVFSRYPVREMVRRGWITGSKDAAALESEVCRFFRVTRIQDEPTLSLAARKSTSYTDQSGAEKAWGFRVLQLAKAVQVATPYDARKFDELIGRLREYAADRENVRRVPALLAKYGIRLVLVKHLSGTKLDGATMWLDDHSPVVAMTLRYDRIDNFWHTLMHELDHIRNCEGSIDSDVFIADDSELPDQERRANAEAAGYLIPRDKLDSFIIRTKPLFYKHRIEAFARLHGVHPGIVVGQLQKRGEMKWSQLRSTLQRFRNTIIGEALTDGWGNSPRLDGDSE